MKITKSTSIKSSVSNNYGNKVSKTDVRSLQNDFSKILDDFGNIYPEIGFELNWHEEKENRYVYSVVYFIEFGDIIDENTGEILFHYDAEDNLGYEIADNIIKSCERILKEKYLLGYTNIWTDAVEDDDGDEFFINFTISPEMGNYGRLGI